MNERQAARAGTVKGVPQAADVESASLSDRRSSAYDEVQAGLVEDSCWAAMRKILGL